MYISLNSLHGFGLYFDIRSSFSEERLNEDKLIVGETVSSRIAGL